MTTTEAVLLAELVKQAKETNKLLKMLVEQGKKAAGEPPTPGRY